MSEDSTTEASFNCKQCGNVFRSTDRRSDICPKCLGDESGSQIPQPSYVHLWDAYVAGAKSGQKHPTATEFEINRSADAHCKLVHSELDPEGFLKLGETK